MEAGLKTGITDTFLQLKLVMDDISPEQFNTVPFKESWTAGQVIDHILRSMSGVDGLMNGPVTKTERDPGEKITALESLFLDTANKFQSPDFIVPGPGPFDKKKQQLALDNAKQDLIKAIGLDLTQEVSSAELPGFGKLTLLEWMHFFRVHTLRHIRQLKNISQKLKKSA